jgi:predicted transcriptional regulator
MKLLGRRWKRVRSKSIFIVVAPVARVKKYLAVSIIQKALEVQEEEQPKVNFESLESKDKRRKVQQF